MDDDGDGLVDCDDPDCAGTEACERTIDTCSNDIDDDRNGTLDCRQESCRALPICREATPSSCLLLPPGSDTGCELGRGCYLADNRRWCALEGSSLAGAACGGDPSDRSQGCAAGYQCGTTDHRCHRICLDRYDCTRNSVCLDRDRTVGTCTLSCFRPTECPSTEDCVALQREGFSLEDGGWAHRCVPKGSVADGTAKRGEPCIDGVCAAGLLCIPEPGRQTCREICQAPIDGIPERRGCPAGELCFAIVPFSGQTAAFEEPYVIGVCR
jgi:hypothetical protein